MMSLFHQMDAEDRLVNFRDYKAPELPSLRGVKKLYLNFETTGLQWWNGDQPVGASLLLPDGTCYYIPWGHKAGGNLEENQCREFFKREVRDIELVNINSRFDNHIAYQWGVDLEAQGCVWSDVAHHAALLDDHRRTFALDVLISDFLNETPLARIDESRMAEHHPAEVAARSIYNVQAVRRLESVFYPRLVEEDLLRVKKLEDEVIFAVCEMERNALLMDVGLLEEWFKSSEQKFLRYLWQIYRETGIKFNPSSPASWSELFKKLGIDWPYFTATGLPNISDSLIKKVDHPTVQLGRKAGKLADLKADFIDKYRKNIGPGGVMRYALHQLRSDDGGTVTGRFSAGAIKIGKGHKIGCNPQQVPDINKQVDKGHDPEYLIRRLYIPHNKTKFVSADAKQIEYRLFADYAGNAKVLGAYAKEPNMSFHKKTHAMVLPYVPDLIYENMKNVNFMKIYGGGMAKLAFMIGEIDEHELERLQKEYPQGVPHSHPRLVKAREVDAIYNRELPEMRPLSELAMHLAKNQCDDRCYDRSGRLSPLHAKHEHQGFVRTLLGRRQRFPRGLRLHKALNGIIQGGAADIMKQKMVEVHKIAKSIGFMPRLTNHDEICGDALAEDTATRLQEALNKQSFPELRVPILWDVKVGSNWAEC